MLPEKNVTNLEISYAAQPSKTYRISAENEISGYIDGLDSIKQAAELILATERYVYPVYSWNYGTELEGLVGNDYEYVVAESRRRITDALLWDDRITKVTEFEFIKQDDALTVAFKVVTQYGNFNMETEVTM